MKKSKEVRCIACPDLTPCAQSQGHTAEANIMLCSSLGWIFVTLAQNRHEVPRKLRGNWSLSKWKQPIHKQKGLVLAEVYRTTSHRKKCTALKRAQFRCTPAASLFCFLGCGYAYRHMTSVVYFHRVQHVSMAQKRQKQQIQPQKIPRPFPPSLPL